VGRGEREKREEGKELERKGVGLSVRRGQGGKEARRQENDSNVVEEKGGKMRR
jgi:hypothetical protein